MAKPQLVIRYCPKCRWLLRASWLSQELLTTFEPYVDGVLLGPAEAGVFTIGVVGDARAASAALATRQGSSCA